MKGKKKMLYHSILMILLILVTPTLTGCSKTVESTPVFLNYYTDINLFSNGNMTFSFVYLDAQETTKLEDLIETGKMKFDNSEFIEITGGKLRPGDTYKDGRLYALNLELALIKEGVSEITQLIIETEDETHIFDLGKWVINIHGDENQHFHIGTHSSVSNKLNHYSFTITSIGEETIQIQEIQTGNFSEFVKNISVAINEVEQDNYLNETINLFDIVEIQVDFHGGMDYNQYAFNPVLVYQYGDESFQYIPPYAVYGIPLDDEQLEEVYNRYLQERDGQ